MTQATMPRGWSTGASAGSRIDTRRVLQYGFGLWAAFFSVGFTLYPLWLGNRVFFQALMGVVLVAASAVTSGAYSTRLDSGFLKHGMVTGIVWPLLCVVMDLMSLSARPQHLVLREYLEQVALPYLAIPIITLAMAQQRARRSARA
ncbi:MAG TPA: hypothetical protein VNW92_14810 [Polyangiaceae bacterium]|jgi:hypothetical protein|nr:hypothetical protein [Polyangiaceae bacterium]